MELAYGPVVVMNLLASAASTTSDVMRPFHPVLVNFTAALIPVSLAADLLGTWTRKDALRATGAWSLFAAAAITPFTALAGWLWLASMEHAHGWQMPYHQWLGTAVAAAVIPLAVWRAWLYRRGRGPGWGYGLVGAVLLAALMVQGDLGGSMSFRRGIVIPSSTQAGSGHEHGGEETGGGTEHAGHKADGLHHDAEQTDTGGGDAESEPHKGSGSHADDTSSESGAHQH